MLFNVRTPRDVLEWLRDIGNSLNDLSSGITWVETLGVRQKLNTDLLLNVSMVAVGHNRSVFVRV